MLAVDGLAGPLIDRVVRALIEGVCRKAIWPTRLASLWSQVFGAALQSANVEENTFGTRVATVAVPALARQDVGAHDERARLGIRLLVNGLLHHFVEPASTPWTK